MLLWACLAALIFGAINAGEPLNDFLTDLRATTHKRPASGDIVLAAIDDPTLKELGTFPLPRRYYAKMLDNLRQLGARRVFFDLTFREKSNPEDDAQFEAALRRMGSNAVLPILTAPDSMTGDQTENFPLAQFSERAQLAHININYGYSGEVRRLPFQMRLGDENYPSFAAKLAGLEAGKGQFLVDYSIDLKTIPRLSGLDVILGRSPARAIAGKDIVIGATFNPLSDRVYVPGSGVIPGVLLSVVGAETLKNGIPVELPWYVGFFAAAALVCACAWANSRLLSTLGISGGIAATIAVPFFLDRHHVSIDMATPLFLLLTVGIALTWSSLREMYRTRGTTNAVSGLPNLAALQEEDVCEGTLVAARVHNYAAIASTLRPEDEKALVEQIAKRLSIGGGDTPLYQGDEGIFAWFAESSPHRATESDLDALHALSRSPVIVGNKQFDLVVTFGVDTEASRSVANRLASALVAADEAHREGLKWKEHDYSDPEDSAWKLSLLSQLDAAIDAGDLWIAYQPKQDVETGRIVGAEALARWTHPEKGPISPLEFILAAEQSNRIEKLTHHVLDNAIRAAAVMNQHGLDFEVSVNLSARLIEDPTLSGRIRTMLDRHGLPPDRLTLEVTETAALGGGAKNIATLHRLRDMGINLSVDDYGTGMSTLDYLQRIPANEIKIDRSFVTGMRANHATRVMVNSTIQLAHSLGQKVVAEGVEDEATFEELRRMKCDLVQGYLVGRPMTFRSLSKKMLGDKREEAA